MTNEEQDSVQHEKNTQAKVKKGAVYIASISITMMFLGLFSAYVVSAGDSFWVKFPMPSFFWISTGIIVISSLTFELAIVLMKRRKASISKFLILSTTLLGLFFAYSQFKGYQQLIDSGVHVVNRIMVSNGRYGDYFEIKQGNDLLVVNGNSFMKKGKFLSEEDNSKLREFAALFAGKDRITRIDYPKYGKEFSLVYRFEPLALRDGVLLREDSTNLELADWVRLEEMMTNIADGRGDFFIRGEFGKDFQMFYAGKPLQYEDRKLYYEGKPLSRGLQLKLYDSKDNASAYLYIITFLHLLHILATLLYLIVFTKRTYSNEFSESNTLGMRATAIFWHFLGVLWLILFTFLILVH